MRSPFAHFFVLHKLLFSPLTFDLNLSLRCNWMDFKIYSAKLPMVVNVVQVKEQFQKKHDKTEKKSVIKS